MTSPMHDFGEKWDDSDVEALLQRRKNGETLKEIAKAMGRSFWGVTSKLARLKVKGVDVSKGTRG